MCVVCPFLKRKCEKIHQESFYWFTFWEELADLAKLFVLLQKAETRSDNPLFFSDMQTVAAM